MIHVRSRTPSKLEKVEAEAGPVQVVHCLRLLSALEDSLGSLGPVVNQILGKALSIEQVGGWKEMVNGFDCEFLACRLGRVRAACCWRTPTRSPSWTW